jgi:hypothetical protein
MVLALSPDLHRLFSSTTPLRLFQQAADDSETHVTAIFATSQQEGQDLRLPAHRTFCLLERQRYTISRTAPRC